jgi:HEAT repeat protein
MRLRQLLLGLVTVVTFAGCGQPPAPKTAHYQPVSHWVATLKDPDAKVRKQAVRILGNVGTNDDAAIPALTQALADTDAAVRIEAIIGLMKIGPPADVAVAALENIRDKDSDATARTYAGRAIERIRGN